MALCAAHPLKNQTMHTTSIKEIRKTQTQSHTHHYSIRNRASYIFHRSAPQFHIPNPKIESQFLNTLPTHPSCVSHHIIAQEDMESAKDDHISTYRTADPNSFPFAKEQRAAKFLNQIGARDWLLSLLRSSCLPLPCPQCARRDAIAKKVGRQNDTTQCQWMMMVCMVCVCYVIGSFDTARLGSMSRNGECDDHVNWGMCFLLVVG